ncbi:RTC4-like domain-containing protein [Nemania sp. FL0031]|nr:RTC4-like domain-containing protein [Nemania sp. FL0031]
MKSMKDRKSMILSQRRVGLSRDFSGGPPLTKVGGKSIGPNQRRGVKTSSLAMKGDSDPLYDPITAPPESSDDEAENVAMKQPTSDDDNNSDEEYKRRLGADIRKTTFIKSTSTTPSSSQSAKPKIRPPRFMKWNAKSSSIDDPSSLAGYKRAAEEDQPKGPNQLEKELEAPRQKKKKKQTAMKYGLQQKTKKQNAPQQRDDSPSSQDSVQPTATKSSFLHIKDISPMKHQSPRKPFKIKRGISDDWDEPEDSKPNFKNIQDSSSPITTPAKRPPRHMSPVDEDEDVEDENPKLTKSIAQGPRNDRRGTQALERKRSKGRKRSSAPKEEACPQRPVFKIPGLDDIDSFDDNGSQGATATPDESQDTSWDPLEIEELESTTAPRCPMCHKEVDRELIEKYSTNGKMSVKQQTDFCRLHKRRSAETAGMEKGYPKIDWEGLKGRCEAHLKFLQGILEGSQASHYRQIFKEKVDSGKNRTLLKSQDNLTPGYYGPRGLQVMTGFIMNALSYVIRKRAIEDKLISARSYTGYVQTVLVPELTVRLIMEDMSVSEERAREVLGESIEIGELLHEETRDIVRIYEKEDDSFLEA